MSEANEKPPSAKPLLTVAAVAPVLALGVCAWFYYAGAQALRAQAREQGSSLYHEGEQAARTPPAPPAAKLPAGDNARLRTLLQQMEHWAQNFTLATAASGACLMLSFVLGFAWWRHAWMSRITQRRRELEDDARQLHAALEEAQLEVDKRAEAQKKLEGELGRFRADLDKRIQERTASLAQTCAALEQELNHRKQAEKSMTVQRQELSRSRDVLEMHVHARTQEVQLLKSRYEYILNSAGEGIYGLDLNGRTTFVNPAAAKMTGGNVDELSNKLENEVFHRQPTNAAPSGNTELRTKAGNLVTEMTFYRMDGTSFPVEYVRTPIMENGRMAGAVAIFKDITERKRAEESLARKAAELARSNAELEQFAYVASHDLQEPLRKIQAFGDRLKAKVDAAKIEDGRDYLERMLGAAARMQTLINDLLTFSRVLSSSQPFVPVDLGVVTREVLGDLEVRIERTKAQVQVGELPTLDADPTQMRQLLQNLISNSLKFQPLGQVPVVQITAQILKRPFSCTKDPTPDDEVCELVVQDNGMGFEEKYLEKVFAVFQRLHGRSDFEGTGVGLAVCRRITDRHGGTITATSKLDEGARFIVTLPMRQPRGGATTGEPS